MILQPDFLTHWKTRKLCNILKHRHAPMYVIRIWALCQTSKRDVIPNDPDTIKAICEYSGDGKKLHKALIDCGFLDASANGYCTVHGWAELNRGLLHNWSAGRKGGRPKKAQLAEGSKPLENPRVSHGKPLENPVVTDGMDKIDKIRVEEREGDTPPPPSDSVVKLLSSITKDAKPEHAECYRQFAVEFGDWCPVNFTDALTIFHRHGIKDRLVELWPFILTDLRGRTENERVQRGAKLFDWSAKDLAAELGKRGTQKKSTPDKPRFIL